MKKQNLFKLSLSAAILTAAILLTGCPREPKKTHNSETDNTTVKTIPIPTISFNLSNAKALATANSTQDRAARDAESEDQSKSDSILQKILENGTVQDALGIEYEGDFARWANLDAVIKPPASANSTDVLLYFDGISDAQVSTEYAEKGYWYLSQLILVHEDNTYDDIVLMDSDSEIPDRVNYSSCAKYAPDGKIFYVSEKLNYEGFNFKSYDPSTKTTTRIFELDRGDNNTQIQEFQMSDDGEYGYFLISSESESGSMTYLKVIPIKKPSDSVELGKIVYGVDGWTYSSYDDCLYYTVRDKEKEDHPAETGEPFQFIYKINKTGKGEKELLQTAFCPAIIPTAENKAWRIYSIGNGTDGTIKTTELNNLLSPDANNPETIAFEIPSIHTYADKYLQVGDTVYLLHDCWNEDSTMKLHTIYSVNTSTKEHKNVMETIPDTDKISIKSWSVNEETLFISGIYENGTAANFKVDLATLDPTAIDSSTAFACIAAL